MECPFLSTYNEEIECFKKCALYNYKGNGGICPFSNISHINTKPYVTGCIKDCYAEKNEEFI
jgi:hypothetical protein